MNSDEVAFEGKKFISAKRASEMTGYTRDYIGQLARAGKLNARRLGRGWFVEAESLFEHKREADLYVPTPPTPDQKEARLEEVVTLDGNMYISVKRASEITSYNKDYIGQLARSGKIKARQVSGRWYVVKEDIVDHKKLQDAQLATQQVISTGLLKKFESVQRNASEEVGPEIMSYSSLCEGPLMPIIPLKKQEIGTMNTTVLISDILDLRKDTFTTKSEKSYKEEKALTIYKSKAALIKRPSLSLVLPATLIATVVLLFGGVIAGVYTHSAHQLFSAAVGALFEYQSIDFQKTFLSSHLRYSR